MSYVGLNVGYRSYLNESIASLSVEIKNSAERLALTEKKDLIGFYSQITNLKGLLDSHLFGSKVFAFLESSTNFRTVYTTVNLSVPERQLTIDGLTASYDTLVQQLLHWEQSKDVERLILEENSLSSDLIKFRARVTLRPGFFALSESDLGVSPSLKAPGEEEEINGSDEVVPATDVQPANN